MILRKLIGSAAGLAGKTVRVVRGSLFGLAGAAAVSYGLGLIYWPLLWISAGVFLLAIDRRSQ